MNADTGHIRQQLELQYAKGLRSVAVCLLHSWTFPEHERLVGQIAKDIGFTQISLSSSLAPSIRAVPRGNAVAVDAYLSPVLRAYVDAFQSHFVDGRAGRSQEFMKSDGGLVAAEKFTGLRAVLSGPAGGVVGCALTSFSAKRQKPIVGFDMVGSPRRSFNNSSLTTFFSCAFVGWNEHGRLEIRRLLRPRLRGTHRRHQGRLPSAGHRDRRRWRRLQAVLQERRLCSRPRVGWRPPRTCLLPKGRRAGHHGRQRCPRSPRPFVVRQHLWKER